MNYPKANLGLSVHTFYLIYKTFKLEGYYGPISIMVKRKPAHVSVILVLKHCWLFLMKLGKIACIQAYPEGTGGARLGEGPPPLLFRKFPLIF